MNEEKKINLDKVCLNWLTVVESTILDDNANAESLEPKLQRIHTYIILRNSRDICTETVFLGTA